MVPEEGGEKQASTWPTPIFNHPRQKISRNRVPPFGHTGFCFLCRAFAAARINTPGTRDLIFNILVGIPLGRVCAPFSKTSIRRIQFLLVSYPKDIIDTVAGGIIPTVFSFPFFLFHS